MNAAQRAEQRKWRESIQDNPNNKYIKRDTLINYDPEHDKRFNAQNEKNKKYLDNILERQKVNEERQFRNENIKLKQADNIFNVQLTKYDGTENQLQRYLTGEVNQDDGRYHRCERWNKGIFYSMADFFNSETEADRRERYNKGIFLTDEEYSDMHPGW